MMNDTIIDQMQEQMFQLKQMEERMQKLKQES
jgi:hypothetical protein